MAHAGAATLAFRGQWAELVQHAMMVIAKPMAPRTWNVFADTSRIRRRSAREPRNPPIVSATEALVESPTTQFPPSNRRILPDVPNFTKQPADRQHYGAALAFAATWDRFGGHRPPSVQWKEVSRLTAGDGVCLPQLVPCSGPRILSLTGAKSVGRSRR